MNKKGLVFKIIIIGLALIGAYLLYQNFFGEEELICVPATCCHATFCVPEGDAPDCSAIQCSAECEPGTLDCNQARCEAINGKCEVVINN